MRSNFVVQLISSVKALVKDHAVLWLKCWSKLNKRSMKEEEEEEEEDRSISGKRREFKSFWDFFFKMFWFFLKYFGEN